LRGDLVGALSADPIAEGGESAGSIASSGERRRRVTDFEQLRAACQSKPHATRARYAGGCRCMLCRAANSRYESTRLQARRNGDWNGIVSAAEARVHMAMLSRRFGIGRHTVAAATGVSDSVLWGIITATRPRCRARTARLILAVDADARADRALVSAKPTWRIIHKLLKLGYTKMQLARWLGSKAKVPSLQLNPRRITARNASNVQRLAANLAAGRISR
jgi:hypothetical protein